MITISYDSTENIIYSKRVGDITVQDIIVYMNNLKLEFSVYNCLYIVEDVGDSNIHYKRDEYAFLFKSIEERIGNYKEVRYAMITRTPADTALSVIFEVQSANIENYVFKTFTTVEAALSWLKKGFYYNESLTSIKK